MYNCKASFTIFFLAITLSLAAQPKVVGFWEVTKVQVGDQNMTPVAKWTRINADGTYQSGNGWLQNAAGTWTFNPQTNAFAAEDPNGLEDEFGPFTVSYAGEQMRWKRTEEGMEVTVTLSPIRELPKATADQLTGLWQLIDAQKEGLSVLEAEDPEAKRFIFIRWDRIYVERDAKGQRSTGYWHIHGHKPELTFLSHNKEKDAESWQVAFQDEQLILTGISDTNRDMEYTFRRLNAFPK